RCGVSARADRAVEVASAIARLEPRENFGHENRFMSALRALPPNSVPLDPEVPEVSLDVGLDAGELAAPARRLPDLEVIGVSDEGRIRPEGGDATEVGRDRDGSLRIAVSLVRCGTDDMPENREGTIGP